VRDSPQILTERPIGESWRGDLLAQSEHGRLAEELRPFSSPSLADPDFDEQRALDVCGGICRGVLGDFTPALLLLSALERQRVQALLAYTHTLFDFARQHGLAGERLAGINQWEFTLETALAGEPVGQPIFVRMAREQRRRAWPARAFDDLSACARRRAIRPRPATPEQADADAERLGRAVASVLLGQEPPGEVSGFLGALIRLRTLQVLGTEVGRNRWPVPVSELPDDRIARMAEVDGRPNPVQLLEVVHGECARLRLRLMRAPRGLVELPAGYRRAAVFCLLAALRILTGLEDGGPEVLRTPPQIGLGDRLALLARARWFRV
jgi:phytoene/squalene synthetase